MIKARLLSILRPLAGVAVSLLFLGSAKADGSHVFWEVAGKHNTVYLLGSVHLLHIDDRALPSVTEDAYLDAEVLVEELNILQMASEMLVPEAIAAQVLPEGQSLAAIIGPELHAQLKVAAKDLGLDTDFLSRLQPWYVASIVSALRLAKAGFNAQDGVDYQIALRAQRDGKPIVGLETAAQQLGFLASMSMEDQRNFLAATLNESEDGEELREITEAWRNGDLVALEALLKQGAEQMPTFFQRIVVDRNRNWMPRIEQMLADPQKDYLVVTGALHMIGKEGLVEMLRDKGYKITRK